MDSAFQQGREQSKYNGTQRFERRPVYGANGRIIGYQQGQVWQNSITGQEHSDMTSYTPNQHNGVHGTHTQRIQTKMKVDASGRPIGP